MMDRLTIRAAEAAVHPKFPDTDAVLIVELDGPRVEVDELFSIVERVCEQCGALTTEVARDQAQRERIWKGRKAAFAAMGRVSPSYYVQDGVVPRTKLPHILRVIQRISEKYTIRIANVFHAGDGNIHPILLFDERDRDEVERVLAAGREILEACIALGGSVTGEHGIGVEKIAQMPLLFAPDDLLAMTKLRAVFDPEQRANPHKIFPDAKVCVETRVPRRQVPI
jgi:glycolate oxidase